MDPNAYRAMVYGPAAVPNFVYRLTHQVYAGHYAAQMRASLRQPDSVAEVAPALPLPYQEEAAHAADGSEPRSRAARQSTRGVPEHQVMVWVAERSLRLLYGVCCYVRLLSKDVRRLDDTFVNHLFDQVEATRDSAQETHNTLCTEVLTAINEQCMIGGDPLDSTVVHAVQMRPGGAKTFGENVVFMLNRTASTSMEGMRTQFLVLKLLDALFSVDSTASFFYTNDLKVLVDIFIRELSDLPDSYELLRQAYLRVFHKLLTRTQLCTVAYKRDQVRRLLDGMLADQHLRDQSPTLRALVQRCADAGWCVEVEPVANVAIVEDVKSEASCVAVMQRETTEGVAILHQAADSRATDEVAALGLLQSTAMVRADLQGELADPTALLWPASTDDDDGDDDAAATGTLDFDVLSLASVSSTSSTDSRRRRAPPRPMQHLEAGSAYRAQASASMPELVPLEADCAPGARRRAPPKPPQSALKTSTPPSAPLAAQASAPSATAAATEAGARSMLARWRKGKADSPNGLMRALARRSHHPAPQEPHMPQPASPGQPTGDLSRRRRAPPPPRAP